jgi:glutamine amidotransferase
VIALIDYGIGNLRSVQKALEAVGGEVCLTSQKDEILEAEKAVLPGVGAFGDGMQGLQQRGLLPAIESLVDRETPLLGICLGMQLLFETSLERGEHLGLGLLAGQVMAFESDRLKIPQTGWNQILPERESILLAGIPQGSYAYFNHGFYCQPADEEVIVASTQYGIRYSSIVARGRLYGVQFHPEKSQSVGLQILKNFVEAG